MNKLFSFEQFSSQKAEQAAAAVQEEQETKRSTSANKFKALLAEYGVAEVKELTEEQRSEFFEKLRGAEVNESTLALSLEELNEAVKVSSKREANKVWNVYTKIFTEATLLTKDSETHIAAIREIFWLAMEDANFSKEAYQLLKLFKAPSKFKTLTVNVAELGKFAVKIGPTTINDYIDTVYSRISSAANWGGITIVEGTALYLDSIGMAGTGQALIDDFNNLFNESLVIGEALFTAKDFNKTLVVYKVDPKAKELYVVDVNTFLMAKKDPNSTEAPKRFQGMFGMKLEDDWRKEFGDLPKVGDILPFKNERALESVQVNEAKYDKKKLLQIIKGKDDILVTTKNGDDFILYAPDNGNDENTAYWDSNLYVVGVVPNEGDEVNIPYGDIVKVQESKVNEAEIKSDEEFKEYAFSVLKKAFGADFDEAKAQDVVDGILGKVKGDYAKAAGMLQSSLG